MGRYCTPPKSKSIWEAMTSGSTGGWAASLGPRNPTNPNDPVGNGWAGPLLTGIAGAIPVAGPFLAAGMGAMGSMNNGSGFQGTDKGWGNLGSTLMGGLQGYGTGMLGAGARGALTGAMTAGSGSMLSKAASGFGSSVGQYNAPVTNFFKGVGEKVGSIFGGGNKAAGSGMWNSPNADPNVMGGIRTGPDAGGWAANSYNSAPKGLGLGTGTVEGAQNAYLNNMGLYSGQASQLAAGTGPGNTSTMVPVGGIQGGVGGAPGAGTAGGYPTWNPFGTAATDVASKAIAPAGGGSFGVSVDWNNILKTGMGQALGMAVSSIGGLFAGGGDEAAMAIMELPEVQQYASMIGQAKTQLGQMGRDELARVLEAPIGSLIPDDNAYFTAMMRRTDEAAQQKKEALTSQYNSIGRANSSEHMQALAEVDTQLFQAKQDLAAVIANDKIKTEMDFRLSALSGALGIDSQAAAELAGLANLSVQEAALKYGLQAAQVEQLRQKYQLETLQRQLQMGGGTAGGGWMDNIINSVSFNVGA